MSPEIITEVVTALKASKILIKNYFCTYRTNKLRFVFQILMYLNFLAVFPLMFIPKKLLVEMYQETVPVLLRYAGVSSLHSLVYKFSPILAFFMFLYLAMSSDSINLSERELFFAIHPLSLFEILFARIVFQGFILMSLMIIYFAVFYLATYIAGCFLSPILAYIVLITLMLTLGMLIEAGKLLRLRWVWIAFSALSVLDYLSKKLTVSLLVYYPLVSILNSYTNLNVFPAFFEFLAVFAFFYFVTNRAKPEFEIVSEKTRKTKDSREVRSVVRITPFRKVLVELERMILKYALIGIIVSTIVAFRFGYIIRAYLNVYWSKMMFLYLIMFSSSIVEAAAAQEASLLWFYRVACNERAYAVSSVLRGTLIVLCIAIPYAILVSPVIGIKSISLVAVSLIIPSYYSLVTTYLSSRTKMKVTRLLHTKRELEDIRFALIMFEILILVLLAAVLFLLPELSVIFLISVVLFIPVIERCARNVEVV